MFLKLTKGVRKTCMETNSKRLENYYSHIMAVSDSYRYTKRYAFVYDKINHQVVSEQDGIIIVRLKLYNGVSIFGHAVCNESDEFRVLLGYNLALNRALENLIMYVKTGELNY